MLENDIAQIVFSEEEIKAAVDRVGAEITRDYAGKKPLLVGILKGSFVFMADLARRIELYCDVDFMAVSSYGNGTSTTGAVRITKDLNQDIFERDVIIVEDILDSGVTLSYLKQYLEGRRPSSLKICTLLDKPARRRSNVYADYVGLTCPDGFIVGYGLDFAEKYRNLPYIGILRPELYS